MRTDVDNVAEVNWYDGALFVVYNTKFPLLLNDCKLFIAVSNKVDLADLIQYDFLGFDRIKHPLRLLANKCSCVIPETDLIELKFG